MSRTVFLDGTFTVSAIMKAHKEVNGNFELPRGEYIYVSMELQSEFNKRGVDAIVLTNIDTWNYFEDELYIRPNIKNNSNSYGFINKYICFIPYAIRDIMFNEKFLVNSIKKYNKEEKKCKIKNH